MKLNLKTVTTLFRRGACVGKGYPRAVAEIHLHVVPNNSCKWSHVGAITRDDYIDLTAKQLKKKVIALRSIATQSTNDRCAWLLEAQCTGDGGSASFNIH